MTIIPGKYFKSIIINPVFSLQFNIKQAEIQKKLKRNRLKNLFMMLSSNQFSLQSQIPEETSAACATFKSALYGPFAEAAQAQGKILKCE